MQKIELHNTQDLIKLFKDYERAEFESITELTDVPVGFSIQKKYPSNIRFKPAITKDKQQDSVAVIWVVFDKEMHKELSRRPLRIRVAMLSKYRSKHFDYDFEDDDCPTLESLEESKKSKQPLDFNFHSEYFYDSETGRISRGDRSEITGVELLSEVYKKHCDSVHPIIGAPVRVALGLKLAFIRILDKSIFVCKWILINVFGRTFTEDYTKSKHLDGYDLSDFGKSNIDSIELAGYKASKRVILIYCFVVILFSWLFMNSDSLGIFNEILKNEFLTVVHGLFLLIIFDLMIPYLVIKLINLLIRVRRSFLNWLLKA